MNALLLDTHVFIWFINGDHILNVAVRKKLTEAIHRNEAYLAAISIWEICMLNKKQRIVLDMPCLEWINKALNLSRIQLLPLTPAVANESCSLPGVFHGDPADQMMVATARVENLSLVTRDKQIIAYGKNKYISTLKI